MDDIETIGKMITKAVAKVSRRITTREANRRHRELEKEAERILLDLLGENGITSSVMDFLDAKEKAQEKEIRDLDDKDHANWKDDDPRWDAVNALWEAIGDTTARRITSRICSGRILKNFTRSAWRTSRGNEGNQNPERLNK